MEQLIGILILVFLPTALASFIHILKDKQTSLFVMFGYYAVIFFEFLSFIKVIKGEYKYTLFQSFESIEILTFFHYLPIEIAVVLLSVKITLCLSRILDCLYLGRIMLTACGCVVLPTCVLHGNIYNAEAIIIIPVFVAFLVISIYRSETFFYDSNFFSNSIFSLDIAVLVFWCVTIYFYLTNQLYLTNASEFDFSYWNFLLYTIIGMVYYGLIIGLCLKVMPENIRYLYSVLIFSITIMGYIQYTFLNNDLGVLDGRADDWESKTYIINSTIWIIGISALIGIAFYYKKKVKRILVGIAIFLCMSQLVSWALLAVYTDKSKSEYMLTNEGLFELGSENNTIVFILDWYDEQIIEEIVNEENDFLNPLEGFTWYRNQTSRYGYTADSIPYLLTGVEWKSDMNEEEYAFFAYDNSEFIKDIKDLGYDIGIYTESSLVKDKYGIIDNYVTDSERSLRLVSTLTTMQRCAKYLFFPYILKSRYHFESYQITNSIVESREYSLLNIRFYNMLQEEKLKIDNNRKKSFKFYHIAGVHDLVFNEFCETVEDGEVDVFSCGRGTMKIVFEYIKQLKELGLYDNATIIISADHGENHLPNQAYLRGLRNTSNPILFIKRSNDHGPIKVSDAPVSHEEFCPSIISYLGGNSEKYGRTYEDIDENEHRIRQTEFFITSKNYYHKFIIDGNATSEDSWRMIK